MIGINKIYKELRYRKGTERRAMYTVGHKKHTKMCFAITFVKLDGF